MSCDGMCAIRRGGRDRYGYDRWGASRLDALLLAGPAAFVAWAERLTPTRAPFLERFVCGAVLVDLDRRDVLYWAAMCFAGGAMERYYRALLAARWPGFTVREAVEPAREFAAALAVEIRELAEARAGATRVEAADDLFTRAWQEMLASYADRPEELAQWIASSGMEGVRAAAEDGCNAWLTVRAADGALFDQLGEASPWQSLLRVGPRLTTLARGGGPRPDMLWPGLERDVQETVFIDEAARTVHWWQDRPDWLCHPGHCAPLWPGWTLVHEDRGTRGHVERSGRPLAAIRLPLADQRAQLAEALARLLDRAGVARAQIVDEAARLLDPGADVAAAEIGPDTPPERAILARLGPRLDALIDRVDGG